MLNNVVINNILKNFGYYTQERNRSVVSYGGLIARFVDGFYQVCTPFQGKVVLGETQREKVVEDKIRRKNLTIRNLIRKPGFSDTKNITIRCIHQTLKFRQFVN